MALTINQDTAFPYTIRPAYNPITYLVNSDKSTEQNFQIQCEIFYDYAGANTRLAVLKKPVEYGTTKAIFDIRNIVQTQEQEQYPYFLTSPATWKFTELKEFRVVFREYYGSTPALTGTPSSGTPFAAWQGSFRYREYQNNQWLTYHVYSGSNNNYKLLTSFENCDDNSGATTGLNTLTNLKPYRKINYNQSVFMSFVQRGLSAKKAVAIGLYDSTFTEIYSAVFMSSNTDTAPERCDFRISPASLVADYGFTTNQVAQAKYMQVVLHSTSVGYNAIGKAYYFEIENCDLPKYKTTYELMWLNRTGGWDGYTFTGKFNRETAVEKSYYKNNITRRISGTSVVNDVYARRKRQFETAITEQYTVSSSNLSQTDYNGLEDLFSSPIVFWNDNGTWRAVNITNTTYQGKTSNVDRIMSLQLTFEIDMDNTLQTW